MGVILHMPSDRDMRLCVWAMAIGSGLTILTGLTLLVTWSPGGFFWSPYPITGWALIRVVLGVFCLLGVATAFFGLSGPAAVHDILEHSQQGYVINGLHFCCSSGAFLFAVSAICVGVRFGQLALIRSEGLPPGMCMPDGLSLGTISGDDVAFLAIGRTLDSFVVWDLQEHRKVMQHNSDWWLVYPGQAQCAAVSSNPRLLVVGCGVAMDLWDYERGKRISEIRPEPEMEFSDGAICISPSGSTVVFAGREDSNPDRDPYHLESAWAIRLYDVNSAHCEDIIRCPQRINKIVFGEDDGTVYGAHVFNPRRLVEWLPGMERSGKGCEGNIRKLSRQGGTWKSEMLAVSEYLLDFVVDREVGRFVCLTTEQEVIQVKCSDGQRQHLGRVPTAVKAVALAVSPGGRVLVCGTRFAKEGNRIAVVAEPNGNIWEFPLPYLGAPHQTWLSEDGRTLIVGGLGRFCTFDLTEHTN